MLIIATIGPSVQEEQVLREIIKNGVGGLRFNFSHGNIHEFNKSIKLARSINKDIHIIQDLTGSKIRVSEQLQSVIKIYNGDKVIFCGEDIYNIQKSKVNEVKVIPLNMPNVMLNNSKIEEISMKDNTMNFNIVSINNFGIVAKVTRGGIVRATKGCNIKGLVRNNIILSNKDKKDIIWGIRNKVDIICQSFVESNGDIIKLKEYIKSINKGVCKQRIWAKVETPNGIKNIEEISEVVDGIVIGRGDLIPEGSIVLTPIYEEDVLYKLRGKNKDVIIATHLLNSMKGGRHPELPEVESIYNQIKQGVTGFMLAGETSIGKDPIRTVRFLKEIVDEYGRILLR